MDRPAQLILASMSERRLQLLRQIGIEPKKISPADIDETPRKKEKPTELARRLAMAKAKFAAENNPDDFILAADTVVACGLRILPKPLDAVAAKNCLMLLSGRRHRVLTGVTIRSPADVTRVRVVETINTFKRLSDAEIDWYLATEEWKGMSGGYAIQGGAARFVRRINGSYSNVVGLPLFETANMLHGVNYPIFS